MNNSYKTIETRAEDERHRKEILDKKAGELIKYLDSPRYQKIAHKMIANLYRLRLGIDG